MTDTKKIKKILIIVENLPVPFDRRVWQEALALKRNGYEVSVICPMMGLFTEPYECMEGVHIHRHPLGIEGKGAGGYLVEYSTALLYQFTLSLKIAMTTGFDIIHACNPPDTIFLIGAFYKLFFKKKFLFDHHDINPELYLAKFGGEKDFFYRLMLFFEKMTFKTADVSIATNESYKKIAITRGNMCPEKVVVVRSGPDLTRTRQVPANPEWKNGRPYLVGYVGVMGQQEGLDLLLQGISILVHGHGRNDIQFVLVGDGTERQNLCCLAASLGINDYVTFPGRLSDDMLMEVLCTSDVCVNPDIVNEMNDKSTMNKIMEYMALGRPIVQFEMTEGRFSAQGASLYAEPNSPESLAIKILEILDDPAMASRMGQTGMNRVIESLQWKHEIPKLLQAYSIVGKG